MQFRVLQSQWKLSRVSKTAKDGQQNGSRLINLCQNEHTLNINQRIDDRFVPHFDVANAVFDVLWKGHV